MRLPSFGYAVAAGAGVGGVIPLVTMVFFWLRVFTTAGESLLYIGPSSIMLMATESMGHSAEAFGILAYSVGINVVLYVVAFSFLWLLAWVIRAWRLSLRDGTTI